MEPQRRSLATLDQVLEHIRRLHRYGYTRTGNWNLSQTCEHLADWMTYPMDGFPKPPFLVGIAFWVIRSVSGKSMLRRVINDQGMPKGRPTLSSTVHPPEGDEAASVERLASTIQRLIEHRGPIHPSPLFGSMTREELIGLQMAHCNHHLNFLIPKDTP